MKNGSRKDDSFSENGQVQEKSKETVQAPTVTPHTLRILRLITSNSSAEYTRKAISILSQIASRSPPIILWDILARLYTSLTIPDESDATGECVIRRNNISLAMEHVAKHIPIGDQMNFLRELDSLDVNVDAGSNDDNENQDIRDESQTKLKSATGGAKDQYNLNQKQSEEQVRREWIKVEDFCDSKLLDLVLTKGRLLLSCSESYYDTKSKHTSKENDYEIENDMLDQLDASAGPSPTFVRDRVNLQRNILARRLGLSGILASSMVQNHHGGNINNIIQDSDLIITSSSPEKCAFNKSARERNIERMQKRKKMEQSLSSPSLNIPAKKIKRGRAGQINEKHGTKDNNDADNASKSSIRKLLLLVLEQQNELESSSSRYLLSHRNPQTLLATDLVYHTFHPSWHIRHGCLLGLLALLKSWRSRVDIIEANKSYNSQSPGQRESFFGRWPQDILARCLCVLALDRFGDYSGQLVKLSGKQGSTTVTVTLAPVREAAAQVISLLFRMAPPTVQYASFRVLQMLLQHESAWEVRHGAILAFKYIAILRGNEPLPRYDAQPQSGIMKEPYFTRHCWNIFRSVVVNGLGDANDDVKGASAQTASSLIAHSRSITSNAGYVDGDFQHQIHSICTHCIGPLWTSLRELKVTSSSSLDLLCCLCEFIEYDCALVLKSIGLVRPQLNQSQRASLSPMAELLKKLCEFLNFELMSIRISCLRTISLIVVPLTQLVVSSNSSACDISESDVTSHHALAEGILDLLCSLLHTLFESFFTDVHFMSESKDDDENESNNAPSGHDNTDFFAEFHSARSTAWEALIEGVNCFLIYKHISNLPFHKTTLGLLLRFFTMASPHETPIHLERWKYNITSKMSNQYQCLQSAAEAYATLYKCQMTNIEADELRLSIAINAFLRSPWPELCECACILLAALASISEDGFKFTTLFHVSRLTLLDLVENAPPCVSISAFSNADMIRNNESLQQLCAGAVDSILRKVHADIPHVEIQSIVAEQLSTLFHIWSDTFNKYGIDLYSANVNRPSVSSVTSMRVSAAVGAAIVSLGQDCLPSRLTQIIRALVTSMKNEITTARSQMTNCSIVKLLQILQKSQKDNHIKVWNKILSNLSGMASIESLSREDPKGYTKKGCTRAKMIIQSFIAQLPAKNTLEDIDPIWLRVKCLASPDPAMYRDADLIKAMILLSSISNSFQRGSKSLVNATTLLLPTIIVLACTSPIVLLRHFAVNVASKMCEVDTEMTMQVVLPLMFKYLRLDSDDPTRLGASRLLNTIVCTTNVSLCGYVRYLIPVVMSMMIDPLKQCADLSASTFSRLVQIAPLIEENSSSHLDLDCWNKECSEKVIDHLIHGKPLPACKIPHRIEDAIRRNGIVLRQYQIEGISWIHFLKSVKLNGALCDDMGLGKTLQALIGIAVAHEQVAPAECGTKTRSLIVCPSSVTGEWVNEVNKLGLSDQNIFKVLLYAGSSRKVQWENSFYTSDLVITSYPILRSDIDKLASIQWTYCVLDEGHLLKNPKTLTAKAARAIRSKHKLILSGTPVQNKVHELWATFDWLMPNYLGSDTEFSAEYANTITRGNLPGANSKDICKSTKKLKQLHQKILPFILRRNKDQVLKELPPKIVADLPCIMTEMQSRLYNEISSTKATKKALEVIKNIVKENKDTGSRNKPNLASIDIENDTLKSLLSLRLICTHPCLGMNRAQHPGIDDDIFQDDSSARFDKSGKLAALNDLLRRAQFCNDETTAADNDDSLLYLNDSNEMPSDEIIGDFDDAIVEQAFATDRVKPISKCLIFAQYTQSLDVVENFLLKPHMPSLRYVRLDGRTKQKDRASIIEAFQFDDNVTCMLLTSKVGSLGLNLQAADTVIFLESDWNPFVDLQAMDRSHRLGQQQHVKVYRLVTSNSIEEKIMAIQRMKIATSEALVNTDNSTMFSMGTDRLLDLFTVADKRMCGDGSNAP